MAVPGTEVEILDKGIEAIGYNTGSFVLNMFKKRGGWEVRRGFGQLAEYTTTMSARFWDGAGAASYSRVPQGFYKHLGSYLFVTSSVRQILSVFSTTAITKNCGRSAVTAFVFAVQIYDLDTNERWEEILTPQTSMGDPLTMYKQHPVYETDSQFSYEGFISGKDEQFFFEEHENILLLGSPSAGTYFYAPTRLRHTRRQQINGMFRRSSVPQYGESPVIRRLDPTPGSSSAVLSQAYLTSDTLSGIVDVASVGFGMVAAAGTAIYFSDGDTPFAFNQENVIPIPTKQPITAVEEFLGSVVVWTEGETWHYTPSEGGIKSAGRLTKVSELIGCVSPLCVTKVGNRLMWMDSNGIHITQNGIAVQTVSQAIQPFFNDFITNPLTSYYTESGSTTTANKQPNTVYRFNPDGASLAHYPKEDLIVASIPEENVSLVFSDGEWALWTYESIVKSVGGTAKVGVTEQISNPQLVADVHGMYLVGSIDSQNLLDDADIWSIAGAAFAEVNDNVQSRSYYVLEYGRGGAIDRNVVDEDYRVPRAEFKATLAYSESLLHYVVLPWVRMEDGFVFPGGEAVASANKVFLLPIAQVLPNGAAVTVGTWAMSFLFDSNHWEPVFTTGSSTEVDFILPNEHLRSYTGFAPGAPAAGVREVQCYLLPGGAASRTGQEIRIYWTNTGTNWTEQEGITTAIYIPMKQRASNVELSGMGLAEGSVAWGANIEFLPWEQQVISSTAIHKEDSVAQPVDWAYKSTQIGATQAERLKARGLFTRMLSHGPGLTADHLDPTWIYGAYNTLLASDYKGWVSQIIDYTGPITGKAAIDAIRSKGTVRTRVLDSAGVLQAKLFNTTNIRYADPATPASGTYLIDDQEVDVLATSDSTKGKTFTYMVFGHMQNRAQRIHVESIKAVLRAAGTRRRTGH
jgi:hypothetical protein